MFGASCEQWQENFGLSKPVLGMSLRKVSFEAFIFSVFREIRNKLSNWPGGQSAQRLYNSYNLCPCARPANVGKCWTGPEFKLSKPVEVWWSCYDLQLCQAVSAAERDITTDEIQERKNYRECSNIKNACVSALTGSVSRKMAKALQSVSELIRNQTKVARLTVTHLKVLNHYAIGSYWLLEKNGIWLVVSRHLQPIFLRTGLSFSDCLSWISRPDTKFSGLRGLSLISAYSAN